MDLALTIINGQSEDNSFINTNLFSHVFQGAVKLVKENLQQFTNSPNFTTQMELTFGEGLNFTSWESSWSQGNLANFPTIQIVSIASLNGAKGAFSRDTNQIYLASEYLNSATASSLTGLLLEEYGHYIDAQLNTVESIGDEGEIFSALVLRNTPNPNAITQDDTATIALNGQTINIEQGSPIIFVKQDATGTGDGFSWANAYIDLQTALQNAPFGSEIWVARGTYLPTATASDRTASFGLLNGVEVYGGFVGSETSRDQRNIGANSTILSGDVGVIGDRSDNSYTVVTARNVTSATVLDGFTITGGNEGTETGRDQRSGAGVYINQADVTLTNLTITDNIATTNGGGMYINAGTPRLTGVTFRGNRASAGGGLYNNNSSPFLNSVSFISNSSSRTGGGIQNATSSPILLNIGLIGNVASTNGGGIYNSRSSPGIYNVLFRNNSATREGGGMASVDSSPLVINATYYGNTAQTGGAMTSANTNSKLTVTNSIFFANQATVDPQINNKNGATTTVSYSIVQGGYSGNNGNIDPLFVSPTNGDFRLQLFSPAINAGTNTPTIANNINTDLNGNPRIANGVVDIGAYEFNLNFDPAQYGASYGDLITAYGYNSDAFTQHYFSSGRYEGRSLDLFDEYRYIASNPSLIPVYGTNSAAATEHYIRYGYSEGRLASSFDPAQYLASNKDLIPLYGYDNLTGATFHYIQYGVNEPRPTDTFDETRYIASYDDLINQYGYNPQGGTEHYIRYGYNEPGRDPLRFNPAIYLASNRDLITYTNQNFSNPDGAFRDYKSVLAFASQHFIVNGLAEKRSRGSFDPIAYLNRRGNEDLRAIYGSDLDGATRHFIEFGFEEGRNSM